MAAAELLKSVALDDLCSRCREEISRFRHGEPFDDGFCFEVFRRAVVERDEGCWRALHEIYHDQVVAWCRRAGAGASVVADDLVGLVWEKFWHSFSAAKFAKAEGTPAVQRYLKACAQTAAIDVAREYSAHLSLNRPVADSDETGPSLGDLLVDASPTPDEALAEEASRAAFWRLIKGQLVTEPERVLTHLKYEVGLKSVEIQTHRPDLFPEVGDVYRVTRNLLDRLRRSPELRRWLGEESS